MNGLPDYESYQPIRIALTNIITYDLILFLKDCSIITDTIFN